MLLSGISLRNRRAARSGPLLASEAAGSKVPPFSPCAATWIPRERPWTPSPRIAGDDFQDASELRFENKEGFEPGLKLEPPAPRW